MRTVLVLLFAAIAGLGLADCGSSGSPKASATTTLTTVRSAGSGRSSRSRGSGKGLAPYLKCLSQHGVNVKKAATVKHKGSGGAGAELKKDPHFAAAFPICKHFLA